MFKLKTRGRFQIWTRETLEKYGFTPEHAAYYIVLLFDGSKPIPFKNQMRLKAGRNTYTVKLKNFSEFII